MNSSREEPAPETSPPRIQERKPLVYVVYVVGAVLVMWALVAVQSAFFIGAFDITMLALPTLVGVIIQ